jgi:O-antigen ligase
VLINAFIFLIFGVIITSGMQYFFPNSFINFWQTVRSQSILLSEDEIGGIKWRLSGPFFNPNTLGYFLLIAIPFLWWVSTGKRSSFIRFISLILMLCSLLVLVFSGSRECYIGFAFVVLTHLFFIRKSNHRIKNRRKFSWLGTAVVILTVILTLYFVRDKIYDRAIKYTLGGTTNIQQIYYQNSSAVRIMLWQAAISALSQYWLIGVGFQQDSEAIAEFFQSSWISETGGSHNSYLQAFVEGGILFFAVFIYLLIKIWSIKKYMLSEYFSGLNHALLAGFAGLLVAAMFGTPFMGVNIMVCFFYLLAILVSSQKKIVKIKQPLLINSQAEELK